MSEDLTRVDSAPHSGQEQKIIPITLKVLAERLTQKRPQLLSPKHKEAGLDHGLISYSFGSLRSEGERKVFLLAAFEPPLFGGRGNDTRYQGYGVDSSSTIQVDVDHEGKDMDRPNEFDVYNLSLKDLLDSNFTGDTQKVEPSEVMVTDNNTEAVKNGTWVMEPGLQTRIREYSDAPRIAEKYICLRGAAAETESSPGFGHLTYEDIAKQATSGDQNSRFTPEDLEWLRTFMKNKGIPIPEA